VNSLDTDKGQAYSPIVVVDISIRGRSSNPNEEPMGSTPYGIASPLATIGPARPPDTEINRAGLGRVRVMVAPH
jgi:hypothetical protein